MQCSLSPNSVSTIAWIPYAVSGIGSLCGGWLTGRLMGAGRSLDFSREAAMSASVAVKPLIFFVTQTPVQLAIVLFSLAFAGQQSWSTLVMILPGDLFPRNAVGSVAAMVGFGGALGGWYSDRWWAICSTTASATRWCSRS